MAAPTRQRRLCKNLPAVCCAAAVAALYATSFFLPVCLVLNDTISGWQAYLAVSPHRAWEAPLQPTEVFQLLVWWLPNPLMWVGIVLLALGRGLSAACTGLLALSAGLSVAFDFDTFRFDFREFREGY